ncbi:MAG: DUF1016 family protein [Variovorax paradoxus]|nr:DUF1016 family protein [Variovorax paradoxus]
MAALMCVGFLALPDPHSEAELDRSLLMNLRRFLAELGQDFCYIASEYLCKWAARTSRSTCCSSTEA